MDISHKLAQTVPQSIAYSAPRTTTVFTSGNSQAVRLPKEFRFDSKQVFIERRGAEIVLRERKTTMGELLKDFVPFTSAEAFAWDAAMAGVTDLPAQPADWA